VVVSRVGQDGLGNQLLDDLRGREMTTDYVQTDPDNPTGRVYVSFNDDGHHSFEIVRNVAWDWLQFDPDMESLAAACDAVCFGSLAQRDAQTRNTIYRFLNAARRAVRLFDVNLRQDYFNRDVLTRSCELATAVKLNDEELPVVARLLNLRSGEAQTPDDPAAADAQTDARTDALIGDMLKRFNLRLVALTRGPRGTVLYTPDADGPRKTQQPPVTYPQAEGAGTVGAGDACAAGLLVGMILRWPLTRTLELANHTGAYVASQPGATPAMPDDLLARVR
jgi:fructokinase